MLEGWAAHLLHRIFGAFVDDLDTEKLDAGVFSGEVHLRDLHLRPDALAMLGLPVQVLVGAVGSVHLQIPWAAPWGSPVALRIEDVRVLVVPVAGAGAPKSGSVDLVQMRRAVNRHLLDSLEDSSDFLGIPHALAERLISALLRRLQVSITGIHLRYQDSSVPATAGLCISSIIAEPTDSKWKPSKGTPSSSKTPTELCHYLVRMEAVSVYLNPGDPSGCWDLKDDYYQWWNDMANSLRDYTMGGRRFEFLLTPTAVKIKASLTQSASNTSNLAHIEVTVRDVCACLTALQCDAIMEMCDSLSRAWIAWPFQDQRPSEGKTKNPRAWWRYAYWATLEQRVRPYTWARVRSIRRQAKLYRIAYSQALAEPRDAERHADSRRLEDGLPLVAAVVARRLARLTVQNVNNEKKNFWYLMPSPDRMLLYEKLGYSEKDTSTKIDHHYSLKVGNFNLSLSQTHKELLHVTVTQTIIEAKPNFTNKSYRATMKIEGVIVEGSCEGNHLIPIISSEHLSDSPAYVLQVTVEKLPKNSFSRYKFHVNLDSIECICNEKSFNDLRLFLSRMEVITKKVMRLDNTISNISEWIDERLRNKWDINLNVKIPYFVLPTGGSYLKAEHLLVVDFGRYTVKTELCKDSTIPEFATQNEIEELVYSKIHVNCSGAQVLFCDNSENWKDARKEKDTSMHMIPKIGFSAMYARSVIDLKTVPTRKFILTIQTLKLNASERWICLLLKFFQLGGSVSCVNKETDEPFCSDRIMEKLPVSYLRHVNKLVSTQSGEKLRRRSNEKKAASIRQKSIQKGVENNMNEAWARVVDLPGLEDNISPNNNIDILLRFVVNEFISTFSKSNDVTDRPYLVLRLGLFASDIAFMTYGPAYQISLGWISLTDKLHTTASGQYLDLIHSPLPTQGNDVVTVLYRKVTANCPDYWTHFHGVETSLVADFGVLNVLLHQESVHTFVKYFKYLSSKLLNDISSSFQRRIYSSLVKLKNILHPRTFIPVPAGSVKYSQSVRFSELRVALHDAERDVAELRVIGVEADALFRANERFVIRTFLGRISIDHPLDESALYSKVLWTDEERVFEAKYVRNAPNIQSSPMDPIETSKPEVVTDGSFKLHLGRIYITVLYKFVIQLKRFIINLDAKSIVERIFHALHGVIQNATATLKNGYKISLAINACNPVLLLPQKSCSPNVVVVDTGSLRIENFFKEKGDIIVENILLKLKDITITRGVMTFSSTLEMQETLLEPVSLNMDIKKLTNLKTLERNWDIDAIIERIHITLGQKDLTSIVAIYRDNIGEGKFQDLFREQLRLSPEATEDESVRDLEAFFCESKHENVVVKLKVDEIEISLFFDGMELLSSPVREPGRGLCAIRIFETSTRVESHADTVDARLALALVQLEERGHPLSTNDNIILGPAQSKTGNVGPVLVNEPPLLDAILKRTRTGDITADIILGGLVLKLSIPLFERIALFCAGCLPSFMAANSVICGLDNLGYESEQMNEQKPFCKSLTLSVRINQPKIIFLVETASNGERCFVTKSEILIDYSRHNDSSTLVLSLSGLQSVLCNSRKEKPTTPFTILKPCDTELSYSKNSSSEKIILALSSIQMRLNPAVMHAAIDVLNDISEHFKVPELIIPLNIRQKELQDDIIWEPTKLETYIPQTVDEQTYCKSSVEKSFSVPKFEVVIVFELDEIQVLLAKVTLELNLSDWSSLINCTAEITLQANYFCDSSQAWEPLVDPVTTEGDEMRPWSVDLRVFQDVGHPMATDDDKILHHVRSKPHSKGSGTNDYDSSSEDMIYLDRSSDACVANRRMKASLSAFLEDSDSETEEGMERLAAAISNLFTGDWNEHEDSDIEDSSEEEVNSEIEVPTDDSKQKANFARCLYITMDAKHPFNFTITPSSLKLLDELLTQYSSKVISIRPETPTFTILNDIGPRTQVELFERIGQNMDEHQLVSTKQFENVDSAPNSPTKMTFTSEEGTNNTFCHQDSGHFEESDSVNSLDFPEETTSQLQEKINRHFFRVFIPDFVPIEVACPKTKWEKIIRVHLKNNSEVYHLAVRHNIERSGRSLVVSSPLEVTNETSYALSVLYRPAVLQQMDVEPLGAMINPFAPFMRVATLEPHETFHVPLHVAYHCQLYVQPAYADGHHVSETSVWWKEIAKDLNATTDIICNPKLPANPEVFALRVNLSPNLRVSNTSSDIPNYSIRLLPPLQVYNFLPYTLEIESNKLQQAMSIEPGDKVSIYSLDLTRDQRFGVKVKYNLKIWTGNLNLTTHLDEKAITLNPNSIDDSKNLIVNIKCERKGSCSVCFYVPYWIVNKTSLLVEVKASSSNAIYSASEREILPFTYKHYSTNPSIQFRVNQSLWSATCNGECPGTTGLVVCRDPERHRKYHFFMKTELSRTNPALTRIITLLPAFVIENKTEKLLRYMEANEKADLWVEINSGETVPFYPETSSMLMHVRYESGSPSTPFRFDQNHFTALQMDKGTSLTIKVSGGVHTPFHIVCRPYQLGDAPIQLENRCNAIYIRVRQHNTESSVVLSPNQGLLFAWPQPATTRVLEWQVYGSTMSVRLDPAKDGYGEEKIRASHTSASPREKLSSDDGSDSSDTGVHSKIRKHKEPSLFWVCYPKGPQRMLLITQDHAVFIDVVRSYFQESCLVELLISIGGMSLSIFSSETEKKEYLHASVCDTPATWEVNVGRTWKMLTFELAAWIEEHYRLSHKKCHIENYVHIDLEKMFMLKPFFAELRRNYWPAVYLHYRKSICRKYYNLKVKNVQVDDNLNKRIVLRPISSNNLSTCSNSFLDLLAIATVSTHHTNFKWIKCSIKDLSVFIDNDMILKLCKLLSENKKFYNEETSTEGYIKDVKMAHYTKATAEDNCDGNNGSTLVENLSLSSWNIHLHTASTATTSIVERRPSVGKILEYLFPHHLSPFMPPSGIVHRISPTEHIRMNNTYNETLDLILYRTVSQFIQQYYSQVLGLQVLLNPFAAQKDEQVLTHIIPDETIGAERTLRAWRYVLGHTATGPAVCEAASRAFFPHQHAPSAHRWRSSSAKDHKRYSFSVPVAVGALMIAPNSGGISSSTDSEWFFRAGSGRALSALAERGAIEANAATDALHRAQALAVPGAPLTLRRGPRYSRPFVGLRPYDSDEASGRYLLERISNGRFASDIYWTHAVLEPKNRPVVIVTLRHIIYLSSCPAFKPCDAEWIVQLDNLLSITSPTLENNDMILHLREPIDSYGQEIHLHGEQTSLEHLYSSVRQVMVITVVDDVITIHS